MSRTAAHVRSLGAAVSEAGKGLPDLPAGGAKEAASRQFDLLIGETQARTSAVDAEAAPPAAWPQASLSRPQEAAATTARPAAVPFTRVFNDPERNRSFWRYLAGNTLYLFGSRMYGVGLPFLVSSLTKNSLLDNGDPRAASAEAMKALLRENRSLVRISHWIAQGVSYLAAPFFSGDGSEGPKKWFVRSSFIRTGLLLLIPGVFFATGLMSYQAALLTLLGLVATHAFFLGIWSAADKASVAIIIGDKSVTAEERVRANSLLTFAAAVALIVAPAIGGQISLLTELFGKSGPGGALIYAVYGLATGAAGLIFAGITLLGRKAAATAPAEAGPAPMGVGSALKGLWSSLKEGVRLIFKDRTLRVLCGLFMISFLFADPMYFNVLPEFAETIIQASPALQGLFQVPVLGWFLKGLTSTPLGYFGLMAAVASLGSIAATALMRPFTLLARRLGFKTEESLTIPAVLLGLLEIPLFWLMIASPSMWAVIGLYGLQSFVTGFMTVMLAGVNQKALGAHTRDEVNKIVAAQSFMLILAAVASTYVYGFILTGIPLAAGLAIAGVVTTLLDLARAVSPWLLYSREQRSGKTR